MQDSKSDYRGHVIIPSESGSKAGPWSANYSVWVPTDNGEYEEKLFGFVQSVFTDKNAAISAAAKEAENKLDEIF
jgi:hypothetical protein